MKPSVASASTKKDKAEETSRLLTPEYALLGFLALRPAHGYDLYHQLSTELQHVWSVSMSQTYNILKRLERQGYIAGTVRALGNRPAQRRFRLTPSGVKRFQAWLDAPPRDSLRAVRTDFLTRLHFMAQLHPDRVVSLLDAQRQQAIIGIARIQASLDAVTAEQTANKLGLQLRVRQLNSLLQWLDDCDAQFRENKS
ncbi:MAG: hypothetical protein HC853_18155 [Anaerolineae bacterium]|nr:hypothetical protein [Anaerolineae bacterium]